MEGAETPPPGGSASPPPAGGPAPPARAPSEETAGVGLRIGAVLLAFALAIVSAVGIAVMADVNDTPLCEEVPSAQQLVGGYECYDFSDSVKPIVVGAGWVGSVLAGVAAILALAFAVRGRGGRWLLTLIAAAAVLLAVSVIAAQA